MSEFIFAAQNNRTISGDDKIFGINKLAKEAAAVYGSENIINSTIGALLDDQGKLMVMPSVIEVLKNLEPEDYADYAPIAGTPEFLELAKEAVFGNHIPSGYIGVIATPGGTGAIRNTIQNYSEPGDVVLTSNWFWSPYGTIADELGRKIETYQLFTEDRGFNHKAFQDKLAELLNKQDRLVIILNAPAHNPTGFTPSDHDWKQIKKAITKGAKNTNKKITLLVDVAYLDFAGEGNEVRKFFNHLSDFPENVLTLVAFSMSKGYTLYGMRSGAVIGISANQNIIDEFKMVNMFSNRGTWSNGTRSAMTVLAKIFSDPEIRRTVEKDREYLYNVLDSRGKAFMKASKEVGLETCPFNAGFFITVPCNNPDKVADLLQKENIFTVPIGAGIRIAISAISEESCKKLPASIKKAIDTVNS